MERMNSSSSNMHVAYPLTVRCSMMPAIRPGTQDLQRLVIQNVIQRATAQSCDEICLFAASSGLQQGLIVGPLCLRLQDDPAPLS